MKNTRCVAFFLTPGTNSNAQKSPAPWRSMGLPAGFPWQGTHFHPEFSTYSDLGLKGSSPRVTVSANPKSHPFGSQAFKTTSGWIKMTETCHPTKTWGWTNKWLMILMGDLLKTPHQQHITWNVHLPSCQAHLNSSLSWCILHIHSCPVRHQSASAGIISRVKKNGGRFWFQQKGVSFRKNMPKGWLSYQPPYPKLERTHFSWSFFVGGNWCKYKYIYIYTLPEN